MATKVVIGAQWGDEGKGKIIDILAQESDVVVRSQGGNNAGHTVEANGVEYKLHLVPSGILGKKTLCLVGNGVVVDPKVLLEELDMLTGKGVSVDNLRIDLRAMSLCLITLCWTTLQSVQEEKATSAPPAGE